MWGSLGSAFRALWLRTTYQLTQRMEGVLDTELVTLKLKRTGEQGVTMSVALLFSLFLWDLGQKREEMLVSCFTYNLLTANSCL